VVLYTPFYDIVKKRHTPHGFASALGTSAIRATFRHPEQNDGVQPPSIVSFDIFTGMVKFGSSAELRIEEFIDVAFLI
jgi:hypothetical protein